MSLPRARPPLADIMVAKSLGRPPALDLGPGPGPGPGPDPELSDFKGQNRRLAEPPHLFFGERGAQLGLGSEREPSSLWVFFFQFQFGGWLGSDLAEMEKALVTELWRARLGRSERRKPGKAHGKPGAAAKLFGHFCHLREKAVAPSQVL
ncbi:hypothetical protein BJV74DRAFT_797887 [Russula compacta]|nr:hypothetical protein BJV74DRAFT_797887 [Russula compacta]